MINNANRLGVALDMASAVEMGEVDDIHSKEENVTDGVVTNGDLVAEDVSNSKERNSSPSSAPDTMEVDEKSEDEEMEVSSIHENEEETNGVVGSIEAEDVDDIEELGDVEEVDEAEGAEDLENVTEVDDADDDVEDVTEVDDANDDVQDITAVEDVEDEEDLETNSVAGTIHSAASVDEDGEVHTVDDDGEVHNIDDDDEENSDDELRETVKDNSDGDDDAVVINDSAELDADGDVMIVDSDSVRENGTVTPDNVIELDSTVKKGSKSKLDLTPRRSGRNANKSKSYTLYSDQEQTPSEESDVEEVLPQDPLACSDPLANDKVSKKPRNSGTIVVKDTKRLVEIASKSTPGSVGKKEPTLVIIDTNSILSGRGPIPLSQNQKKTTPSYPVLPVALPAQGVYPANMRATITPIPMNNPSSKQAPIVPAATITPPTPILPSLTDDMFVVEAPSFIVPYVYEKPPVKDLKEFVKNMANEIRKMIEEEKIREAEERKKDKSNDAENSKDSDDEDDKKDDKSDVEEVEEKKEDLNKRHTYFDSPIGKFYVDIGSGLVQEFVQTDLLKQQKRKRDREGGQNSATTKTIHSLLKSLEYTKENNRPYKMAMKKCEFCSYKTESALAMAFHLETPHMKNFVYKCNFCTFEVRSPHDILFHMEAEHCVRGRLERAPAFHQCPNCPFEDNQKGKLSRHTVACARKFKPERNLEPPIDWEPPAKIPRAPRMKQQSLSTTAAMYQAMTKNSQMQFMKMQQNMQQTALNRGRGRPSLGMPSKQHSVVKSPGVYKTSVPGGASVLVPTNYQISGNQLYQVLGGQDLGSRIGGPMGGYIPSMSAPTSTVTIQNSTNKTKTVHQPSISITPLPRGTTGSSLSNTTISPSTGGAKPGDSNSKNSFVICEICDGYIKDLEQLRNHMQWIHKVKIHPKMIYNRPPLNCQKCQFRFFTDQGLERHLLGSHGLVTSSMQEAANKCKDSGRCPVCGRVYQWKLLNHVARDHNMTLKPAHLSYKCTVCTATFGMYKQFENHVYSAHSVVAKRSMDKKTTPNSTPKSESLLKPLKINDEITIIPQMPKSNGAGSSKEGSPSSNSKNNTSGNSKIGDTSISRADRLARRKTSLIGDN